ncbi:hypothetical protein FACS18947_6650 [Bacteroidia bacterium]|nr:hypothetical protein FACS18947_6650 [Bacteroidia bacterium]
MEIASNFIILMFASGALFVFNPLHAVITITLSALCFVLFKPFGKPIERKALSVTRENKVYVSFIEDVFSGSKIIRQFSIHEQVEREHHVVCDSSEKAKLLLGSTKAMLWAGSNAYQVFLFMFTMCIGSYFVYKGLYTVGMMVAAAQLLPKISFSARLIVEDYASLKSVKPILCDINKKYREVEHLLSKGNDLSMSSKELHKGISIQNLSFSYDDEKDANKTIVIKGFNYTFRPGKKYAIIGSSGSGKTTLFKLILKEESVKVGQIFIDDRDLAAMSDEEILKTISCMNQNVFVFADTIRNNITLYKEIDDNTYDDVIRLCKLDELISSYPNLDNREIALNGENISGGQKQRIALARALLSNTPVLLLDEALNALDSATAKEILSGILKLDVMVIAILHGYDSEMLSEFDYIISFDENVMYDVAYRPGGACDTV